MNLINNDQLDLGLLYANSQRPEAYERSAHYIWTDDHVGREMLKFHLDPSLDSASLKHTAIDAQVRWIAERVGQKRGTNLLDIGCGPGLYCERFHNIGCGVTGVDFNANSLAYAREQAGKGGLAIEYAYQNYVHLAYEEEFDVVTLINRDFGALIPEERDQVIGAVWRALRPGGYFVFDTLSLQYLERRSAERTTCDVYPDSGFWAPGPHLVIEHTLVYDPEHAQLDRQIVVIPSGDMKVFHNWLTYYTGDEVAAFLEHSGFEIVETNPFLSDEVYDEPELYLGFVAVKR
jgi:SAM-dependent methyltransferase